MDARAGVREAPTDPFVDLLVPVTLHHFRAMQGKPLPPVNNGYH
jgi:hypothetical protein